MGARNGVEANTRKRQRNELSATSSEICAVNAEEETTPSKRRSIRNTSAYIYRTLFKEGVNSDVVIDALGGEWRLHRLYLVQSPYFKSMFSGQWRESTQPAIHLDIPDGNIDREALDVALSSLYRDDIDLEDHRVCPTLGAASMLQLDGLREHCVQFMRANLSRSSVVYFLQASTLYAVEEVRESCMRWLQLHSVWDSSCSLLRGVDQRLLCQLLGSEETMVMQVEMDVYSMAKKWLFLQLCPDWSGEAGKLLQTSDKYFRELGEKNEAAFLSTEDGRPYVSVFQCVRLADIIGDCASIHSIEQDEIIPEEWLAPVYKQQWTSMVAVEQGVDPGPEVVTPEVFSKTCTRCGRVLTENVMYCWRWTGFSFGFDLLVTYANSEVYIKRNTHSQPCHSSVSLRPRRSIMLRIRAASTVDGQLSLSEDSGLVRMALEPDEELSVMTLQQPVHFPLYIGMNYIITAS